MLNEDEIRRALKGTFCEGGWTLLYCEAGQRGSQDGNLRPLWTIFESAMKLEEECPWEWMTLAGIPGQMSYRILTDGDLIPLGLENKPAFFALDEKLQKAKDILREIAHADRDIVFEN